MKALLRSSAALLTAINQCIRRLLSQVKVLFCFLSVACAHAGTITASSTSQSDVQAAVAQANDGDTVVIPATSASGINWTQSLIISKSITLIGAGTVSPKITKINNMIPWDGTNNTSVIVIAFTQTEGDKPVRVTGIYFDNIETPTYDHCCGYAGPDKSGVRVEGKSTNDYGDAYMNNADLTRVRIDHCAFHKGKMTVALYGHVEGVVDNNSFMNADIAVGVWGDDSTSWSRPIVPGTQHAMFIEDNLFTVDDNVDWTPVDHQCYSQEGGRPVIRYNTFDLTGFTKDSNYFIDEHGNQNYYNVAHWNFRGQPIVEIYNNILKAHSTYQFMELRGGSVLVYNNTMTTSDASNGAIEMWEEEAWQTSMFSPLRTQWPAEDQINATFFWGNTLNGGSANIIAGNPRVPDGGSAERNLIKPNRDYWLSPPNVTTHTTYPNPPSPSSGYPNAYVPITSYTPFTYPHPLRSAQGPTPTPLPPTGLHLATPTP
jgi:hypothetical protein